MRKLSLVICLFSTLFLFGCDTKSYSLKVGSDLLFNQNNYFDPYGDVIVNGSDISNVEIIGLELLGLNEDNRITEFGSFTLRYCLIIDGDLVDQKYRTIVVTYNKILNGLLYNTDFLAGTKEWGIVDWQKSLEVSTSNDMLEIKQSSVDEYIWDQSIYQYVNNLELNKQYTITFDAYATNPKVIKVCLAQVFSVYPYSYNVMNEHDITISTELDTYTIEFTSSQPNLVDGFDFNLALVRLEFKFGKYNDLNNQISNIYFDNIVIKETSV